MSAHRMIPTPLDGAPCEYGFLTLSKPPPSLNNIFATSRKTARRFKTDAYTTWQTLATLQLRKHKPWHVRGKVRVFLCFSRKDTKADLDNLIKPVLDLLVSAGRICDDRNVVEVRASFDPVLLNGTWIKIEAENLNAIAQAASVAARPAAPVGPVSGPRRRGDGMSVRILLGDVRARLAELPDESVDLALYSPPYWGLRDYGVGGQLGMEPTLAEHITTQVEVAREVRRVLKPTGSCFLNYGDCYATAPNGRSAAATKAAGGDDRTFRDKPFSTVGGGIKAKDLCMIPNRLAIALQDDGWWVRSEIIWGKTNPMPDSSGSQRPSTSHEKVFLRNYEPAALPVWEMAIEPFPGAHFATFPTALAKRAILAACPPGGTVLDPFGGAGTTGLVADRLGRNAILIELNPEYVEIARRRIAKDSLLFADVAIEDPTKPRFSAGGERSDRVGEPHSSSPPPSQETV